MKHLPLILIFTIALGTLSAGSTSLRKSDQSRPPRRHPWTHLLSKNSIPNATTQSKSPNYNRALVILVDFQEETPDDLLTTGNGKFQLEPDPSYLYSIASPPHNRQYYEANLEAVRYYYLAASSGSYDLQYDVWPKSKAAYTLPHSMSYYNPAGASAEVFLARMEEYFQAAFTLADTEDTLINFADYGHYIIIHAGSDWQHDVNGDSPSDIPSFFINVGEGKEVVVDNGAHRIYNACNVPATISQDFSESGEGTIYRSGYGALNSVLAHEFGHSLGLVDLYNVRNFQPMVGMFDIMDSGGSGLLMDGPLDDGSYVLVEGILPALPGAFSRNLLFGDYFRQNGLLREASELSPDLITQLAASSKKPGSGPTIPHIIRFDLNPTEYILLENRSVDPDGDGSTAVFSALDGRVVLYPTPAGDNSNTPSYEYDYLLPSFIKADGSAIGGGIMAWHVNNNIIFDQGYYDTEGIFISNYENNTVNTSYVNRGVEVIEADGLPDIGNQYSWYWTGTQYEYFHRFEPVLDSAGKWVMWSNDSWRPTLSAQTVPSLISDNGAPSFYWLDEIGNPGAVMSFKLKSGIFDHSQSLDLSEGDIFTAPVINSSFDVSENLPVFAGDDFYLLSSRLVEDRQNWVDELGSFDYQSSAPDFQPIICNQYPDSYKELVLVHADTLSIVDFANDAFGISKVLFDAPVFSTPLPFANKLMVPLQDAMYAVSNGMLSAGNPNLGQIKTMAAYGENFVAIRTGTLFIVSPDLQIIRQFDTGALDFSAYEPVVYHNPESGELLLILMTATGDVYRFEGDSFSRIYVHMGTSLPTQMGIAKSTNVSPILIFAAGSSAFAMQTDGTYRPGFPASIFPHQVKAGGHVKALQTDQISFLFPLQDSGYLALSESGVILPMLSLINSSATGVDYLYWQSGSSTLFWYYASANGKLEIKSLADITTDPVIWNGFRNGDNGVASFEQTEINTPGQAKNMFVFPSPVNLNSFRLRLENFLESGNYRIFNISGQLIAQGDIPLASHQNRDIIIDSSSFSSGVYLMSVKIGSSSRTIKFAVEK